MNSTANSICVVIPVHNNHATVRRVTEHCLQHHPHVLIIDDGSTDAPVGERLAGLPVTLLTHPENRGKGSALRTAMTWLRERQTDWMITIDGDGQHDPDDLPAFLAAIPEHPDSILVGARDFSSPTIPGGSRFGRKFSNLWIRLECGATVSDSQSGFRAYPLRHLAKIPCRGDHYEFEVEILTQAVWRGLTLVDIPIRVWYPERKEDRVSSFRQGLDNARISRTHTRLMARRLVPWPHPQLVERPGTITVRDFLRHPWTSSRRLFAGKGSPRELALAAAVGSLLAVLPLIGLHTAAILYAASRLRLNLIMAVNIQHLYMPPLAPLACIQVGHYLYHGRWLIPESFRAALQDIPHYIGLWLLGSLVLAPVLAALAGVVVYGIARAITNRAAKQDKADGKTIQRGTRLGILFFAMVSRFGGLRHAYAFLYPVCFYYLCVDRTAVRATMPYVRHLYPHAGWLRRIDKVFRIFVSQGRMLIDRHALLSGRVPFAIEVANRDRFKALAGGERGAILLTSHVGNWQIVMHELRMINKTIHLVMRPEDNLAVKAALKLDEDKDNVRIIQTSAAFGGAVEIVQALSAGDVVCIMGDRSHAIDTVTVNFLGQPAHFPYSSFKLAALAEVPVAVLLSAKTGTNAYRIEIPEIFHPVKKVGGGDKQRMWAHYVQAYVQTLEEFLLRYPCQYFIYQDLWKDAVIAQDTISSFDNARLTRI